MAELTKLIETADSYIGAKEGSRTDLRYSKLIQAYSSAAGNKQAYDGQGCCETVIGLFVLSFGVRRTRELLPVTNYSKGQFNMWKTGQLDRTPKIGSIVYFASDKEVDHEELVLDIRGNVLYTWNGNSLHEVKKMKRYLTDKTIKGYGHPDWHADRDVLRYQWEQAAIDYISIKRGASGPLVLWLQEYLHTEGYYDGYFDGIFADVLDSAVRRYQQAHKLQVDGVVGRFTWRSML